MALERINKEQETTDHPSLAGDLWQSAKYSCVQGTYDGVRNLVNHLGGDIADRQLVAAPQTTDSTLHQWAQMAGYGLGKAPLLALAYLGVRSASAPFVTEVGGSVERAGSLSLMKLPSSEYSLIKLSTAAGLTQGLTGNA